jgi:retinol dehydrogenase 12
VPKVSSSRRNPNSSRKTCLPASTARSSANCGIGQKLARILYAKNSKVYLACSPEEKATNSITSIRKAVPKSSGQLVFLSLDLADLTEVTAAAQRFLAQESIPHVLFNDAGVMIGPANSPLKTVQA